MGVIYSGQTIMNTTIDGSSMSSLQLGLKNALANVGWTVTQNGSSTNLWALKSATTPQGYAGAIWIQQNSGSNSVTLNAASINATAYNSPLLTMSGQEMQVGAGFVYQCIANPYYFYLFRQAVPCPSLQSFMMSVPYVPPFLTGLITETVIAAQPTGTGPSISIPSLGLFGGMNGYYSQLNGQGRTGSGQWGINGISSYSKPIWFDGSCDYYEPRVQSFSTSSTGTQAGTFLAIGYLWDALVINLPIPRNTIIPYDGGSWLVITEALDPGLMLKIA